MEVGQGPNESCSAKEKKNYIKVLTGNHVANAFPIQNGPRQGDVLPPLLFKFVLEYSIRRPQKCRWCRNSMRNISGCSTNILMIISFGYNNNIIRKSQKF
jgi:hypothetical protein